MLAEQAGLSAVIVRKLEQNARRSARISTLSALARALDIPVGILLGGTPADKPTGALARPAHRVRVSEAEQSRPTLLRALITQRHWQRFQTFEAQFRHAARELAEHEHDPDLAKLTVSSRQWERWYAGSVKTEPHPDACRVLEHMFGYPVQQLLATRETGSNQPYGPSDDDHHQYGSLQSLDKNLSGAALESTSALCDAEASNVGPATLEQLQQDLRRAALAYLKADSAPLVKELCRIRYEALHLLEGRQPLRYRRELYLFAGWAMTLLGWASIDLGRPDASETHCHAAWHFAEEAGHDGMRAWICKASQVAAYWGGRPEDAARYSERGLTFALKSGGETALMLASTVALGYARLGRREEATNMLARAGEIDTTTGDHSEPGGPLSCSHERALSYWADTYLALGDAKRARMVAGRAISISESKPEASRNLGTERMTRLHVVRANITLRELDGAKSALIPVLATPIELRAMPLLTQLREVSDRLGNVRQGPRGAPLVLEMSEAISSFCEERPSVGPQR
jgi:transcriptional regulator with XRE-family HTH domain/tetratricopeptide (TPR) repeat protein